jgi:hypothetical protein
MELQTNEQNTSGALRPILQLKQVELIKSKNFEQASNLMPNRIEQVFDQPKVREVILAVGATNVCLQLKFELIKLASLMSVGGNLNQAQVDFIADGLISKYPNESLADFKICFGRGAMGNYGDIQRMDGITIGIWFEKYLEEKYELMEAKMMKEKDTIYEPVTKITEGVAPPEKAKEYLQQMLESVKGMEAKQPAPLNEKDVYNEGKEKPKRELHKPSPLEYLVDQATRSEWMRENFDIITSNKKPGFKEYQEWLSEKDQHYIEMVKDEILAKEIKASKKYPL